MWRFIADCFKRFEYSKMFDDKHTYYYAELHDIVKSHGERMRMTLSQGTKCAILCDSGLHSAIAILSCWYADMIPIPMSKHYGDNNCNAIINLTEPSVCVTDNVNECTFPVIYDITVGMFYGDLFFAQTEKEDILLDIAIIMCTSGSTGVPKAALITHEGLQRNVKAIAEYFNINNKDTMLIARPLYHCAVLTGELLISLHNGSNITFFDEVYNPTKLIEFAKSSQSTVLCGTPTLFNHLSFLLKRQQTNLSISKLALSGECLSTEIAQRIRSVFIEADIYSVYGLTENSPRVSYLPCEYFDLYSESVGKPLIDTELKIDNKPDSINYLVNNLTVQTSNYGKSSATTER